MEKAKRHLKKDRVLRGVINRVNLKPRRAHKRYFESLCVSIINQQLSGKAADAIEQKFRNLFGGKFPKPEAVLKKSDARLRAAGLSFPKIAYIKSLAKLIQQGKIKFNKFSKLDDEQIIGQLIQVKGIGRWTAEMFLMFCLNRPDVFSHGDLGLRTAIKKLYKLDRDRHSKKYHALVESWKPYRTAAARYLWASQRLNDKN